MQTVTLSSIDSTESFAVTLRLGKDLVVGQEALLDTGADSWCLIDLQLVELLCQRYSLGRIQLARQIKVSGYNGVPGDNIRETLTLPSLLEGYYQAATTFFITPLGRYKVIIGRRWLKHHGAILDCAVDAILWRENHCLHDHAPFPAAPSQQLTATTNQPVKVARRER